MKKILTVFFAVFCLAFMGICQDVSDQNVDFLLVDNDRQDGQPFRTPSEIPIAGYYNSASNALYLYFRSNVGCVNVRIINQSTGEYAAEMVPTDSGVQQIALPFSGSAVIVYVEYSANQTYYAQINNNTL